MVSAVALLSGGLDSTLAATVVAKMGIKVTALTFLNYFGCGDSTKGGCGNARIEYDDDEFQIKLCHLGMEFVEIVRNPKHGYGKNMNPCIDCRILMLRKAKEFMEAIKADFIITGEVLGQRPMSQRKIEQLELIDKEAGLQGLVLRPLSACFLPETIPELKGWVTRDRMYGIRGRSRREQLKLAKELGVSEFLTPAGGCLLTDPAYSNRLRDLFKFVSDTSEIDPTDLLLLKVGRHLRINPDTKIIVGRDEFENNQIDVLAKEGRSSHIIEPTNVTGPTILIVGKIDDEILSLGAEILAFYCRRKLKGKPVQGNIISQPDSSLVREIEAYSSEKIEDLIRGKIL